MTVPLGGSVSHLSVGSAAPPTSAAPSALTPQQLRARFVPFDSARPVLFSVVDTEEEFQWGAPFSRQQTSVRAMREIARGHELLTAYGVHPTYVIDYPVATQPDGYLPLLDLAADGRCTIGAHLHPWVNPPFSEMVTAVHSYGCNLPPAVERAKLERLRDAIATRFPQPRVFKAGRYGFGRTTAAAIDALGFAVDMSVNPALEPTADGGPSFEAFDSRPFLFGRRSLLEVPCTRAYIGRAGRLRVPIHRLANRPALHRLHAPGVLARAGLSNLVMLSPEGSTLFELRALTAALYRQGLRTFSLTFHSPSLEPGHTPYATTTAERDALLDRIRGFCDFFFGTLGGISLTPIAFRDRLLAAGGFSS